MLFSLEALQAGKGDCLVLHYGDAASPHLIVIDGGPGGIYGGSLRPRLKTLHEKFAKGGKLKIDMLMVSHIDDDHIHGVVDWMREIDGGSAVPCNIATLWYNSFDAILSNTASELRSRVASLADPATSPEDGGANGVSPLTAKVIAASVGQGRELRERADALGILLNGGFDGLVMAPKTGRATVSRPAGLKFHVVGPGRARLEALQTEWDKDVKKNPDPVVTAAFADKSIPNLSSIVAVAELGGKRMLLTGDARGDDVLEGLRSAGFLDSDGKVHFDLIKMPHHGSNRNMTKKWLTDVTADHYLISANGENGNPDPDTVQWLCEARGDEPFTIHLTNEKMVDPKDSNDVGKAVKKVLAANPGAKRKVVFGAPNVVNLLDPLKF